MQDWAGKSKHPHQKKHQQQSRGKFPTAVRLEMVFSGSNLGSNKNQKSSEPGWKGRLAWTSKWIPDPKRKSNGPWNLFHRFFRFQPLVVGFCSHERSCYHYSARFLTQKTATNHENLAILITTKWFPLLSSCTFQKKLLVIGLISLKCLMIFVIFW